MSDQAAPPPSAGRPSVLSLNINSKTGLFMAYMPFLKRGGLFIPTTRPYALGDEIFMLLTLMDEPARLPIAGTVVWVTPAGAQGSKPQGIGIQFSDDESGQAARTKIETLLATHAGSDRQTHSI